jgi:hypothetical protein
VPIKVPRIRNHGDDAKKVRFTSTILPPYLRKAKSIEDLLHWRFSGRAGHFSGVERSGSVNHDDFTAQGL